MQLLLPEVEGPHNCTTIDLQSTCSARSTSTCLGMDTNVSHPSLTYRGVHAHLSIGSLSSTSMIDHADVDGPSARGRAKYHQLLPPIPPQTTTASSRHLLHEKTDNVDSSKLLSIERPCLARARRTADYGLRTTLIPRPSQ